MSQRNKDEVLREERALAVNREESSMGEQRKISQVIEAYTRAIKSFKDSEVELLRASNKDKNKLIIAFGVIALMAVASNMLLMPLKTVETFFLRVDNNSGFTDIVRPADMVQDSTRIDDEFWLASYVRTRESYNWYSQKGAYAFVQALSYSGVFSAYRNFQLSPKGYTAVLTDTAQISTEVNGITFLTRENGTGTAHVRFTKSVLDRDGNPDPQRPATAWLAVISYDYKNSAKSKGVQWLNPRGFGVSSYSTSEEVVGGRQ